MLPYNRGDNNDQKKSQVGDSGVQSDGSDTEENVSPNNTAPEGKGENREETTTGRAALNQAQPAAPTSAKEQNGEHDINNAQESLNLLGRASNGAYSALQSIYSGLGSVLQGTLSTTTTAASAIATGTSNVVSAVTSSPQIPTQTVATLQQINKACTDLGSACSAVNYSFSGNEPNLEFLITEGFRLINKLRAENRKLENQTKSVLAVQMLRAYVELFEYTIPSLNTKNLINFDDNDEIRRKIERLNFRTSHDLMPRTTDGLGAAEILESISKIDALLKEDLKPLSTMMKNPYDLFSVIDKANTHIGKAANDFADTLEHHRNFYAVTRSWADNLQQSAYFCIIAAFCILVPLIIQIVGIAQKYEAGAAGYVAFSIVIIVTIGLSVLMPMLVNKTKKLEVTLNDKIASLNAKQTDLTEEEKEELDKHLKEVRWNTAKRESFLWSLVTCSILAMLMGPQIIGSDTKIHVSIYVLLMCIHVIFCIVIPLTHGAHSDRIFPAVEETPDQEMQEPTHARFVKSLYNLLVCIENGYWSSIRFTENLMCSNKETLITDPQLQENRQAEEGNQREIS